MKKLLLLLLFIPAMTFLKAQSRPETKDEVIKEWAFLGESKTQLDISYRVIKCSGAGEIHLQIFNENPNDQTARFEISVVNPDGESFTRRIAFSVERAAIVQPDCNSEGTLKDLKISVPSGYDLTGLKVKIVFK